MMSGKRRGGGDGRGLKARVKTARRRKPASTRWLERQLNDPYVARARAEGRRSRAAFKLMEIDERYHLLRQGDRVVDLGAAPGGWSAIAAERVGSSPADPRVVAIDLLDTDPIPGVVVIKGDFMDEDAPASLKAALAGHPADVVLSDMAAPTVGHRRTDHLRIMALAEAAAAFACEVLRPGGHFLAKVLRGGTEQTLLAELKRRFDRVHHVKPPASRPDSAELYLLAMGYRGRGTDAGSCVAFPI